MLSDNSYTIIGVERVLGKLNPAKARLRTSQAIKESASEVLRELKAHTPRATGGTQRSENVQLQGAPPLVARIGSRAEHIEYVEKGRRPGRPPPIDALRPWMRARGIPQERAFQVARAIGLHGTKGAFMFKAAFDAAPAIVNRQLAIAARMIEADFGK